MTELTGNSQPAPEGPPTPPAESASPAIGCGSYVVIYTMIAYLGLFSLLFAGITWLVRGVIVEFGNAWPWWLTPVLTLGHWLALAVPILPLLYFWRAPGKLRGVAWLWAAGLAYLLLQMPLRLIPPGSRYGWPLAQIVLHVILSAVVLGWLGRRRLPRPAGPYAPALLLAALLGLPWLSLGAIGGLLETALQLLAGLLLGCLAAALIVILLPPDPDSRRWDFGTGAHVAGAFLLMLGFGFGASVFQMFMLLVLALAGWLVPALLHWGRAKPAAGWLAAALFLGLMAALPYQTFDVPELEISLGFGLFSLWEWLLIATAIFLVLVLLATILTFMLRDRLSGAPRLRWAAGGAWLLALGFWVFIGQPGLHGERLFVILADQADVAAAYELPDVASRRAFVYETLVAHADGTQADLRDALDLLQVDYTPYYLVNALEVEGGPLLRLWLANRPEVDRVLESPRLRPLPAEPSVSAGGASAPEGPPWNLTLIGADRVWEEFGVRGEGIVIGQSDSGVQWDHPELQRTYRGSAGNHDYNWFDPWFGTTVPEDWAGHGTHTLGTVLGESVGVAPEATWFACVNLGRNLGNAALYTDCMQFMLAPFPLAGDPLRDGDPALGAHVLNNSWGCPPVEGCDANALLPAVQALRAAGIFVVASAGNSGPGCETVDSPLPVYEDVFAVGAIDRYGVITSFSSRGPVSVDGSGRL
ncbi:MAG: S8 family serine peptidase, partial [Anaerolineales bacterium]|nr:S8 family serine peptidase [Anaerolineales bacterium]